jgi:hypothetical protein
MMIRRLCAAILTAAVIVLFFVDPAAAQRTTNVCLDVCDKLPASATQKLCCQARCFCEYPPDYMSPQERRSACKDVKLLCR